MVRTITDIDLDLMARASEILGTETVSDTIDAAFGEVIRRAAGRTLVALAEDGAFDALLEPGAEHRMWR
ncbi:type II toxin-antitoxin system VapB family antitoxin [Fodinicola acaciae]|uniref:type II toxin-antitoxin system VapB family antitoxin n=1 Tax=Fodinicola acaciae TaxID=2681555 RepID=UPI0013CF5688|nr:type II toxin-antitoxin system VapB family antitoxin [Fodinicola acaciae]